MNEDELREFLKQHLRIKVNSYRERTVNELYATTEIDLMLDDEVISHEIAQSLLQEENY